MNARVRRRLRSVGSAVWRPAFRCDNAPSPDHSLVRWVIEGAADPAALHQTGGCCRTGACHGDSGTIAGKGADPSRWSGQRGKRILKVEMLLRKAERLCRPLSVRQVRRTADATRRFDPAQSGTGRASLGVSSHASIPATHERSWVKKMPHLIIDGGESRGSSLQTCRHREPDCFPT